MVSKPATQKNNKITSASCCLDFKSAKFSLNHHHERGANCHGSKTWNTKTKQGQRSVIVVLELAT
jgi:hypothetical protein